MSNPNILPRQRFDLEVLRDCKWELLIMGIDKPTGRPMSGARHMRVTITETEEVRECYWCKGVCKCSEA